MASNLNLNINGDARRARAALDDVASGSARAARVADQLSRSFDHLEHEATQAQRRIDDLNDEISNNGPTAELTAEITALQQRLAHLGDERQGITSLRGQFERSTRAAQQLDHQLASTRRELDRLNDEYSRGGDPNVLRRLQEQQRELDRLGNTRRRIQTEDEDNQSRLARVAAEAHRVQQIRDLEARRQRDQDERNRRGFLGNAVRDAAIFGRRRIGSLATAATDYADANKGSLAGKTIIAGAAIPVAVTAIAGVGGAIIGASAAGAVALGVKGALDGPNGEGIKDAFGSLVGDLQGRFTASTIDWFEPLVASADTFRDALDDIPIEQIFGDAKNYIEPLAKGLAGLTEGTGKGFAALVHEAGPVVERLGQEFTELGDDVNVAFTAISQGSQGGADALGDILDLTGGIIRGFGKVVLGAEKMYEFLEDAPVSGWFYDIYADLVESDAPAAVPAFAHDLDGVAQSADGVAASSDKAAAALAGLDEQFRQSLGIALDAVEAHSKYEEAQDNLVEGWHRGKDALNATNEAGRENIDLALAYVQSAADVRDAAIAAGDGSKAATDAANTAYANQIAGLEGILVKLGLSKQAAHDFATQFQNLDGTTVTVGIVTRHSDQYLPAGVSLGNLQHHAAGGPIGETGWAIVGEQGPELRWLNAGDHIFDAQKTAQMLASRSSGGSGSSGGGGGGGLTLGVRGGDSALGSFLQRLIDGGVLQLFDVNGQPVGTRP